MRAFNFCLKPFNKVTVREMTGGTVRGRSEEPTSMGRHSPRVSTVSTLLAPELAGPGAEGEHVPAWHYTGKHTASCSSHITTERAGRVPHPAAFTPIPPFLLQ